jgi:pSer/pThr/pTyr-binding forkhead associated (FHA) protein
MSIRAEQFAVVVEDGSGRRTTVGLDSQEKVFGRWPPPRTDVQLRDNQVARSHFEVRWNPDASTHEINDYGQVYSPTVNGEILRGTCRLLQPGDVIAIGQHTIWYVDLTQTVHMGE